MAKQPQSLFLEEWLRSIISINSDKSGSSAQEIIQAWADLRDSLKRQSFSTHHIQGLKMLASSQASIYVADPQAKLLLSILSLQNLSLPHESYPLFFRLLYIWVRKSRQSSVVVDSAVEILLPFFSKQSLSDESSIFFSEGILILGAFSYQFSASKNSKIACLELFCKLLEKYRYMSSSDELTSNVLAGAGYALSSSESKFFPRIFDILLSIWASEGDPSCSISQGLMLLHLIEWVLSNIFNLRSLDKIDQLKELLENVRPTHSLLALVMAASGVLRATNRSGASGFLHLKNSAEQCIGIVARDYVSRTNSFDPGNDPRPSYLLQFVAIALSRSGSVSYRSSLLMTLALALVTEIFPLQRIYKKVLKLNDENLVMMLDDMKRHLGSIIFKEAGSITGVFCNQYALADEDSKNKVENLMWNYCQEIYSWHRQVKIMLHGRGDNIITEIEKIAESTFLMVVVFSLGVTKHKLDSRINQETKLHISVRILVSFSCIEYFRRMRLPEYMDTIRAAIATVQENESACISFVESIPSYNALTNNHGSADSAKMKYLWATDEVQTARIVFYMRVIPTFIHQLPASVFKVVAPSMFLYMGHPNGKVSRCSHSIFVAFMSSGKDSILDERDLLKEQLVFYYIQRALEGYPGITPFEGMASGVVALVRHLPAGSPSIFYCIHSLVEKAKSLCGTVSIDETDLWKNWEGDLEPSKKLLDLNLQLLFLVDIQVLPSLMKLLAQLIGQLPGDGQNMLLDQLYQQIAESDDVTRKPVLISWLQSLSYLCSQGSSKRETADSRSMGSLSVNGVNARL